MNHLSKTIFATALLAASLAAAVARESTPGESLERGFLSPPDSAKPYTWWHWMNGNITREGITKDLEEMKRAGLGGAQMFNVSDGILPGPVKFMSPQWRELTKHAIGEAGRLGLDLSMHNCAGWSSTGGPWITPEYGMQKVVCSSARATGPMKLSMALPQPETKLDFYRDIAVLAFPTPPAERMAMTAANPRVTVSAKGQDGARLLDGDPTTQIALPLPERGAPQTIQFEFARPFAARSLSIVCGSGKGSHGGEIQTSQDGKRFDTLRSFSISNDGKGRSAQAVTFDAVSAPIYRIVFTRAGGKLRRMVFSEMELSPSYRIENWAAKAGYVRAGEIRPAASKGVGADVVIPLKGIVNLTSRMDPSGRLTWDAPEGDWVILRFGHTPTGTPNHPSPPEGLGLECDKLSREAVDVHFAAHIDRILADAADLPAKGLKGLLIDSYEVGSQNWTARFAGEFRKRRGYDPIPYLPAMQGRVVESLEVSERFLWDLRRTIADLFADNYYGYFRELCRQRGMELWVEAYGSGNFDNITCGGRGDIPMSEFWAGKAGDDSRAKQAASVAHTYGRQYVGAESFTASAENGKWQNHPYSLKALGDFMYCGGVNRFVFHRYAHQPWLNFKPGMTMGPHGFHFEWTVTWWDEAPAWLQYLSRCQFLLQQGLFAGDLCYFIGEDSPNAMPAKERLTPAPPDGVDYDGCDAEVLLMRMSVKDGRVVLPDGMSYRLLVLPPGQRMTPEVARKVRTLVAGGAWVVGPKPVGSPSLSGYPGCDAEVRSIGEEMWGKCDGGAIKESAYGRGKVIWGKPVEEILASIHLPPDFECLTPEEAPLHWIHRIAEGADVYFVANQAPQYLQAVCAFRAEGKRPEVWRPDTGRIEPCPVYEVENGRTEIPLQFDPCGSFFVVFRKKDDGAHYVSARREGDGGAAAASSGKANELVILKATYGAPENKAEERMDLTKKLQGLVKDGALNAVAGNKLAGRDPAPLIVKDLKVEYTMNGERKSVTVPEKGFLRISRAAEETGKAPKFEIAVADDGRPELIAFEAGEYSVADASGKAAKVRVESVPEPLTVTGPWEVHFQPGWGAPEKTTFDQLISWTRHGDPGVKYYSGAATYYRTIDVPAGLIGKDRRLYLDLGDVRVIAVARLNGKDLGALWKPPFRADITDVVQPGDNALEVKVVNLWPNRLIGDEQLPDDCEWTPGGSLKAWPKWLLEGKPRPGKRLTFTTWKHWRKDSPLLESGLLGPVRILTAERTPL